MKYFDTLSIKQKMRGMIFSITLAVTLASVFHLYGFFATYLQHSFVMILSSQL